MDGDDWGQQALEEEGASSFRAPPTAAQKAWVGAPKQGAKRSEAHPTPGGRQRAGLGGIGTGWAHGWRAALHSACSPGELGLGLLGKGLLRPGGVEWSWGSARLGSAHLLDGGHGVPALRHPGGEVGGGGRLVVLIGLGHEFRHGDLVRHGEEEEEEGRRKEGRQGREGKEERRRRSRSRSRGRTRRERLGREGGRRAGRGGTAGGAGVAAVAVATERVGGRRRYLLQGNALV